MAGAAGLHRPAAPACFFFTHHSPLITPLPPTPPSHSTPPGFDWLADAVRAEITKRDPPMSISELARQTGIHREQLSYWLNGERHLRSDLVADVLTTLQLTIKPPRRK